MAHGHPSQYYCKKCNMFGLIPRFSFDRNCPKCNGCVQPITNEEIRKGLGRLIIEKILYSFTWIKLERDDNASNK